VKALYSSEKPENDYHVIRRHISEKKEFLDGVFLDVN